MWNIPNCYARECSAYNRSQGDRICHANSYARSNSDSYAYGGSDTNSYAHHNADKHTH